MKFSTCRGRTMVRREALYLEKRSNHSPQDNDKVSLFCYLSHKRENLEVLFDWFVIGQF